MENFTGMKKSHQILFFALSLILFLSGNIAFAGVQFDGRDDYVDVSRITAFDGATLLSVAFWTYDGTDSNFGYYEV